MSDTRKIFSLKQVVSSIRKTIEDRYHQAYWVKAEMHKLNIYPSGHAFPELVQKEEDKIVAQLGASIWKHHLQRINEQFTRVVKEPLTEGTTLLMHVKIQFHETFGLSLQILDIDPNYSLGELQREREETLKRLQNEGVLNKNQQLQFPLLPKRIAIISADSSKGLSDFRKVIDTNQWGYRFFTMLFPAYLQGDGASESIRNQLKRIERVKSHFDIVVIVRGGGGEVGLSCYNHYELCRAIVDFPLPILTGIGHSTNLTVAEMVAFRNAITPTELGDLLIQAFHNFSVPVLESSKSLRRYSEQLLILQIQKFEAEIKHFKQHAEVYVERKKGILLRHAEWMRTSSAKSISEQRIHLHSFAEKTSTTSIYSFERNREQLKQFQITLRWSSTREIDLRKQMVFHQENLAQLLDPQRVLKRGYSIVRFNERILSESNIPIEGKTVHIETYDQQIDADVIRIKSKKT